MMHPASDITQWTPRQLKESMTINTAYDYYYDYDYGDNKGGNSGANIESMTDQQQSLPR